MTRSKMKALFPADLIKEFKVEKQTLSDLSASTIEYYRPLRFCFDEIDRSTPLHVITNRYDNIMAFAYVQNAVLELAKNNRTHFHIEEKHYIKPTRKSKGKEVIKSVPKATALGEKLWFILKLDGIRRREDFINYEVSPLIDLFTTLAEEMGVFHMRQMHFNDSVWRGDAAETELMNNFIAELREKVRAAGFLYKLQKLARKHRDNRKGLHRYIHELFVHHADLLVIRLDLGIFQNHSENITAQSILKMFSKLMHNKQDKAIFDGLVGWARRLEAGASKGCHLHVILFFNAKIRNPFFDHRIADDIGLAWRKVTGDMGCYFNCNNKKNRYKSLGIGRIHRKDAEGRKNLLLAADYLTKQETVIRLVPKGKYKIFERGQLPVKAKKKPKTPAILAKADEIAGLGNYAKISPTKS